MLRTLHYRTDGVDEGFDATEISDRCDDGVMWIDIVDATEEDLALVAEEFSLHPLAMDDARYHGQRPKLVRYADHAFIVAYSSELAEVDVFTGPTWVITIRGHNDDGAEWDSARARKRYEMLVAGRRPDTGLLLYAILDDLVDGYFEKLDAAEGKVEEFEELVFSLDGRERDVQQRMYAVRRELLLYRRNVVPLREVLMALLRHEVAWVDDDELLHLADVHDRVLRVTDLVDASRELVGNAVEAHLSLISNQVNVAMRKMTAWGSIIIVPTLIASVYGMNFEHMPELGWRLGYAWAIGLMAGAAIGLYAYFRRKGWV